VTVKASGLFLPALAALQVAATRAGVRLTTRKGALIVAFVAVALSSLVVALALHPAVSRYIGAVTPMLAPSGGAFHCSRAVECAPRYLLVALGAPIAAWLVGMAFRCAAVAALLILALRSPRDAAGRLCFAATFLFLYFQYLHPSFWPWYTLSLLPLLPYADRSLLPAMLAQPIAGVAHYVLNFPYDCDRRPAVVAIVSVLRTLIIALPPTVLLARRPSGGGAAPADSG
jgi:hypothetical protein